MKPSIGNVSWWIFLGMTRQPDVNLGGGFKHFLFSSLLGELIPFDGFFSDGLKPPTSNFWASLGHRWILGMACYSSQDSSLTWHFSRDMDLSTGNLGKYATLPQTNSSHLKMDGWNSIFFLLGWPVFRSELLVLGIVYMIFQIYSSSPTDSLRVMEQHPKNNTNQTPNWAMKKNIVV